MERPSILFFETSDGPPVSRLMHSALIPGHHSITLHDRLRVCTSTTRLRRRESRDGAGEEGR